MVQVLRYKDFSDSYVIIEAQEGLSVKRAVPIPDWTKYVVVVNGIKSDENHIIQPKDIVIIRMIPKISTTTALIVFGVLALGTAVYAGVKAYQANKEAQAAKKKIEELKNISNDSVTNIPYLKGASNSIATGKTQPFVIGRHLFTPYILNGGGGSSRGYHTISGDYGSDSFYNIVLEGGFAKQVIESLSCDDVKVASLFPVDSQPQENSSSNPKYYFNSNSEFASEDSYIEIAQDGAAFENEEFNQKIVEQEVSDQLKKADADDYEDLYYTLEKNTMDCTVCIMFNGLYQMNSSGTKSAREVKVIPAWSPDYAEILAEGGDTSQAQWYGVGDGLTEDTEFQFRQTTETTATVTHTGTYRYTATSSQTSSNSIKEAANKNKNRWAFVSGEDILNDSRTTLSYSTKKSTAYKTKNNKVYRWTVTITATYTESITTKNEFLSNTFSFNKNSQLRFEAKKAFSFADNFTLNSAGTYDQRQYPITLRLSCPTNALSGNTEVSDCYVEYIHSHCYDTEKSAEAGSLVAERVIGETEAAKSTLIGIHIKATSTNEEKIGKINVITNGLAPVPTLNDGSWSWNLSDKQITSNPASWLIEILTSDTHAASKIDFENEIDSESFGDLYQYCEEQDITVNKVLTSGTKKADVIEGILTVCHAALYQNIYGKISVAIDKEKENLVALFNEQNLISFEYEKTVSLDVDGIKCTFVDSNSDFQENDFTAYYDTDAEVTEDTVLREVSLDGITNEAQARRHAHYIMANDKLRPLKATAKVGNEGIFFTLYSKILIQHPSLKIGLGSAVVKGLIVNSENMIVGVDLYEPVDIDYSNNFSVIIQCVGEDYCTPLARSCAPVYEQDLILTQGSALTLSDGTNVRIVSKAFSYVTNEPVSLLSGSFLTLSDGTALEAGITRYQTKRVDSIFFTTPISLDAAVIPHKGDVLSYGYELDTVSREFTITAIKPNGSEGYTLELYDYNEAIFDYDSVEIPDYEVTITERRAIEGVKPSEVPEVYPTYEETNSIAEGIARTVAETVAAEAVADKTPRYLGILTSLPASANEGDWFAAKNITGFSTGKVYKYTKVTGGYEWQLLTETSASYMEMMAALPDIMSVMSSSTSDGYFSTVFAKLLVASKAFIEKLSASAIELHKDSDGNGGVIQSENYDEDEGTGWQIDYEGNAKFNNGEFNGKINATSGVIKNLTVEGTLTAGGEGQNKGRVNCAIGEYHQLEPNTEYYFDYWNAFKIIIHGVADTTINGEFTIFPTLPLVTSSQISKTIFNNNITLGTKTKNYGSEPFTYKHTLVTFKTTKEAYCYIINL